MAKKNDADASPTASELVLTRVFDAPRALVYRMWTEREHLAQWWGPKAFTNPRCEIDVRRGGTIHIDMRGPDGTVYPMTGTFEEIAPPGRLVFSCGALGPDGRPMFEVLTTVLLVEEGGKTTLTVRARVTKAGADAAPYLKGMKQGWTQSLVRLGKRVKEAAMEQSKREILVSRTFDAPRKLVWRAMTDPKQVVHWWGPRGFTTTIERMDVRPGGTWRHLMRGPDGVEYPNQSTFIEVVKPERIVYRHGGSRRGGPAVSFVSTWTFEERSPGRTTVTMRGVFPSPEERARVVREFGAVEGAKQTLARLGEHLPTMGAA